MIRVTIELISAVSASKNKTLGILDIANDGTGDQEIGNYVATLHAEYTQPNGRECRILGFLRHRQSVWSLVGAALKQMGHTKHVLKSKG